VTVLVLIGMLAAVQCARLPSPFQFQQNYNYVNNTLCWNTDMYLVVDVVNDNGSIQVVKNFFNGIVDKLDIRTEFIRVGVVDGRNTRIQLSAKDGTDRTAVKQFIKDLSPGTAEPPDISQSLELVYSSVDVHRNLVVVIVRDGSRTGAGSAVLAKQETRKAYQKCWGYTAVVLGVAITAGQNDQGLRDMFIGHESDLYPVQSEQDLDISLANIIAKRICPSGSNTNMCVADVFFVIDSLANSDPVVTRVKNFMRSVATKLTITSSSVNVGLYASDAVHFNPDEGISMDQFETWINQIGISTFGTYLARPLDAIYRYISNHENNQLYLNQQSTRRMQNNFVIFVRDRTAVSNPTVIDAVQRVRGFNSSVYTMAVGDKVDQQNLNNIYDYHKPELRMLKDYTELSYQLGRELANTICRFDPDPSRQGGAVGLRSIGVLASLIVALGAHYLRH